MTVMASLLSLVLVTGKFKSWILLEASAEKWTRMGKLATRPCTLQLASQNLFILKMTRLLHVRYKCVARCQHICPID